jgi:hypothetical protein
MRDVFASLGQCLGMNGQVLCQLRLDTTGHRGCHNGSGNLSLVAGYSHEIFPSRKTSEAELTL